MVKNSHNNLWWLQKRRKSMKNLAKICYLAKYTWKGRRSLFSNAPEISIKMWSIRFAIKNHQKSGQKVSKMAKYGSIFVHSTLKFRRGISAGGIPNVLSTARPAHAVLWLWMGLFVHFSSSRCDLEMNHSSHRQIRYSSFTVYRSKSCYRG